MAVCGCTFSPGTKAVDAAMFDAGDAAVGSDAAPGWSVDLASQRAVPATTAEWEALLSAAQLSAISPDHLWQMQESTGNLRDAIGVADLQPLNLTTYADSISGWSRVAASTIATVANDGYYTNATGNLDGTSYFVLAYVAVDGAPAMNASLLGVGQNGDHHYVGLTTTPDFAADAIGGSATVGSIGPGSAVHPIALELDATHSTYTIYTDQERIVGPMRATSAQGALTVFGNVTATATVTHYLYAALWNGAYAERSDADVKALLTTMGWTVSGY
jgi:hypothetical protein